MIQRIKYELKKMLQKGFAENSQTSQETGFHEGEEKEGRSSVIK